MTLTTLDCFLRGGKRRPKPHMSIFLYSQQASIGFILHAAADSSQCGLCNHDHSSRLLMCSFLLFSKIRTVNWRWSAQVARVLSETMSSLCFEHACPSSSQPPDSHHNTKCIQSTYSYLVFFSVYNWAEWPFSQLGIKTKTYGLKFPKELNHCERRHHCHFRLSTFSFVCNASSCLF